MTKEETIDFGNVQVDKCDFCDKTCLRDKFYPLNCPSRFESFIDNISLPFFPKKERRAVSGICLKCVLKALLHICKDNSSEAKNYVEEITKQNVLEKLT